MRLIVTLIFMLVTLTVQAQEINNIAPPKTEHVVWNKTPIAITLPVGQERMISFPSEVLFHAALSPTLTSDKLTVLNNAGTLYLKAKLPFLPIRVPVVIKDSGIVVLLDIEAKGSDDATPISVVLPRQANTTDHPSVINTNPPVTDVSLIRYAIQALYAPQRLFQENTVITRTPMYTTKSVNLLNHNNVIAMPLASWRGGDHYETAVLLKNRWNNTVNLSPQLIKGSWLSASFYPTALITAQGSLHDRTTLFLISEQSFNQALNATPGMIR